MRVVGGNLRTAQLVGLPASRLVLLACALGGGDLIPHEREQRRNDERRPGVLFAQEFCRDEIDVALAPASALHNQQRAAPFQQMFNRIELSRAERGLRVTGGLAEKFYSFRMKAV